MKVGYCQFAPSFGDLDSTLARLSRLAGSMPDADVIVLPELCNSGYNFSSREEALKLSEPIGDSRFIRHLEELARKMNAYFVSGFNERDGEALYNSSVLIGPRGVIGSYRKIHLFMNEKNLFKRGDAGINVFDIGACRIGMLICYDWMFPEVWRIAALKGADIICHPCNLVLPGLAQKAVPVHALINGVYVVTANRIGREGAVTFTGLSTIASPKGEVLHQASPASDEAFSIEIDVAAARNKMIAAGNDRFGDRIVDEYQYLTR